MQAVRAEIKKWEKSFKARNDRDPTVDDIRAQPDIADKYRLYKRLSKEAAATASAPKTPPKAPVLLPSSSRVAEATAPLATFNPFSPSKNKGKTRAEQGLTRPNATSQNPFSTPSKIFPKSVRSVSPCEPSTSRQPDASVHPTAPSTALTRARKRLRGEPVSPSPNKEKRQRVLPISGPPLELSDVDDDPSHADTNELESITIGDTPVKPPAGNKSFTTLFQESLAPLVLEPKKDNGGSTAQGKNSIAPRYSSVDTLPSFDEELGWLKANRVQAKKKQHTLNLKSDKGKAVMKTSTSVVEKEPKSHIPLKRPLLDAESDSSNTQQRPGAHFPPLVPPSPPPETSASAPSTSNQSRSKHGSTANRRKKVKFSNTSGEETGEETDGDPGPTIKIIDATFQRPKHQYRGDDDWDENLESDPDPVLTYTVRSKAQGSPPGTHPHFDDSPLLQHDTEAEGKVEVDLPEKLRDVLALDMQDFKARDKHEARVVDSLLYNRRTVHYDPHKGGEIWSVGEDLHRTRIRWDGELEVLPDTDGDDEWEGEPVPWEVAEL
ncbi:hypothetical protein M378DRAFT_241486 [Amanita muscaria Koide BX008]|uniref:DNA replication regulator SLD2 n=1 Tax=Amanita muscaria (strain Koide BX008) TaxID=946122 RepID=A0A0C2XBF9_AMAMK|nr:hypothetical protein M378DRAFT_241486 [Amanita muscaria Koide BX008]